MNTSQRNIVRVGCFLLAALAVLAGLNSGDIPGVLAGITGAAALVIVGKIVWAGRPMGPVVGLGSDILEAESLMARAAERESVPVARALPKRSGPRLVKARPTDPKATKTDAPEIVRLTTCVDCWADNRGDAYNCRKCGALMRSRRGSSTRE